MGLRVGIRERGGTNSLWEMGQLLLSMGLDRREVCTLGVKGHQPK